MAGDADHWVSASPSLILTGSAILIREAEVAGAAVLPDRADLERLR